ncbi:penicillin-binding protein 1A [Geomesophilobacter sediminis]|uniref:Penicillin-binding protein 1A n=1 Tax=Geomesophilobacter sediminis TaxID=2798584 RepID=A0A8J7M0K3_9BACT|nr:PBP1A family penicillin-binding protein [Geomesophilobacter sediminis]MBJ6725637.1 PBP1A family penicillin-binding protein [Geomesophilobacter sediminis]
MEIYTGPQQGAHRRKKGSSTGKTVATVIAGILVLVLLAFAGYFFYLLGALPKVDRLADYRPPIVSQVYGEDGSLVGEFYLERRTVVAVDKIPRRLIQAFVSAEDSNFYQHKGIDYLGIARAVVKNVISLRKKEGASTITQQVAKSMLLTPEKKFSRKLKEAILAKRMEERLSKDEILYIYLNQIYLGAGAYGVELAAETYFGKEVDKLNLAEMAMLAGLPKAPNTYSPIKHLDKAKERQAYVLERMVKEGYVTQAEADHAKATPIEIHSLKKVNPEQSAYFLEQVRQQLEEKYGEERLYKDGLKIYTTMNAEMQKGAYEAVVNGLKAVDKRQGFRGPAKFLAETEVDGFCKKIEDSIDTVSMKQGATYPGVVTAIAEGKRELTVRVGDRTGTLSKKNMDWAGQVKLVSAFGNPGEKRAIALGSVLDVQVKEPDTNKQGAVFALDQAPEAQAALIAIDPMTGGVRAMVGGYDFKKSQFNRAMQAKRNPGSAFKPIIYAAAIDKGMTPATIIDDSPVEYESGGDRAWKPKNYDNIYRGPVTMREALTNSINIVSVKILESIGVNSAIEYAKKLGITSPLAANLTLALGSSSLTPMELTSAYAVFASGGYRMTPYFITKVVDREGQVLEEVQTPKVPVFAPVSSAAANPDGSGDQPAPAVPAAPAAPGMVPANAVPVISSDTAYIMTNLMESVVTSGTGGRARALGRPVAGKTGTTNDMKDAWFVGYVPQLVAGVWVGYDQERSLGAGGSGGQAAAPIWTEFMQRAVAGMPVKRFTVPSNVTFAQINPRTGHLAKDGEEGAMTECFVNGTEPTTYDGEAPTEGETPPAEDKSATLQ